MIQILQIKKSTENYFRNLDQGPFWENILKNISWFEAFIACIKLLEKALV